MRTQKIANEIPGQRTIVADCGEMHRIFGDEQEAGTQYTLAVGRLLNINKWHTFIGQELVFTLTDPKGTAVNRLPRPGDLISYGPILGARDEDKDWFRIEDYYERHEPEMKYDLFALRLRPTDDPVDDVAFDDEECGQACTTLIIQRSGARLSSSEKIRDESSNGKIMYARPRFAEPCEMNTPWQKFIENVLN